VVVKSVSLLTPTTALVRFDAIRREPGGGAGEQRPYTAVIAFRYTGAPARAEDRFLNPLGFQVTRYRRDAETPANAVVRVPPPAVAVAPVVAAPVVTAPMVADADGYACCGLASGRGAYNHHSSASERHRQRSAGRPGPRGGAMSRLVTLALTALVLAAPTAASAVQRPHARQRRSAHPDGVLRSRRGRRSGRATSATS
jgi:hypothetical protein